MAGAQFGNVNSSFLDQNGVVNTKIKFFLHFLFAQFLGSIFLLTQFMSNLTNIHRVYVHIEK